MCCEFYEQIHVNTTGSGVKPGKGQGAWQHRGIFSLLLIAKHSAMAIYPCWEGCDMPGLGTISMEQWVLCLSDCQFHLQTVFFFFYWNKKRGCVHPAACMSHLSQTPWAVQLRAAWGILWSTTANKKEPASCFLSDEAKHLAWRFPYEGHFYKKFNWAS